MSKSPVTFTMNKSMFSFLKTLPIGSRILFFRNLHVAVDSKKYTAKSVAERINVAPQTITSIERNESKIPSFRVVYRLAKEYGIPIDYLADEYYDEDNSFIDEEV